MQSLLRTRPENLDDLTVQVALVRPGPIQGEGRPPVHRNRERLREDPSYVPPFDHPLLEEPLGETLGVVVFQDQVLDVAMALAGFSVGEAEGLRRAMSRKRSEEAIEAFRQRFVEGALAQRRRPRDRGRGLRQARRLLGLRLPEVARGRVRAARLPVGVAAPLLPGRVPLRAPERAADGLLPAVDARARRAAARGRGAPAGRQPRAAKCAIEDGSGAGRARVRPRVGEDDAAMRSSPSASGTAVRRGARPRAAARARARRARGARRLGRVRRARRGRDAAALAARPRPARADGAGLGRRRAPARAPARADGRDARAAASRRLGADARRLPPDELSRSACTRWSCCARTFPTGRSRSASCASSTARTRGRGRRHGGRAPAPVDRERGSSSCCSRTSTAR